MTFRLARRFRSDLIQGAGRTILRCLLEVGRAQ